MVFIPKNLSSHLPQFSGQSDIYPGKVRTHMPFTSQVIAHVYLDSEGIVYVISSVLECGNIELDLLK